MRLLFMGDGDVPRGPDDRLQLPRLYIAGSPQ